MRSVTLNKLRGRLMISLILGALVFVGLSAYADFNDVIDGLGDFKWQYLPLVLGLTFLNYVLRFLKWQFYLKTIGVEGLPGCGQRPDLLLRPRHGRHAGQGRRMAEVLPPARDARHAVQPLGADHHRRAPDRQPRARRARLGGSAGLRQRLAGIRRRAGWRRRAVLRRGAHQPLAYWLLHRLEHVPLVSRFAQHAEEFYTSSYALLSPVALGSMTLLSVVSWGFEVLASTVVLLGLGVDGSADTLLKASFIMPASTLASALLLTPGGLGVAEGGITGLSQVLLDLTKSSAAVGDPGRSASARCGSASSSGSSPWAS